MYRHVAYACIAIAASLMLTPRTADAGERTHLGYGRLITNDYIGDGEDRWRTMSWTSSRVWGPEWTGTAPSTFGEMIELRLSAEIFAPVDLDSPAAGDRPYACALAVGAHTHFVWKGFETAVGADLVVTGSGTGLGDLQRAVHDLLGVQEPSGATLDNQIGGGLHPTFVGEIARDLSLTPNIHLRPFMEGRAGAETLLRAGFDMTFGSVGADDFMSRTSTTGQRYRVVSGEGATGFSFLVGGDIAHVADSIYLPADRGIALTSSRDRLRAGLHWQGEEASAFYGVTYLSEEFESQSEGQILGSIRVNLSF
jgi:hypothetical protein